MLKLLRMIAAVKDSVVNNPSFTVKEQLGYAGGLLGNEMGQDCVGTYSDKFRKDFMNIEPSKYILTGNISTVLSFLIPPIAGAMLDKPIVGNRGGARPVLLASPIPFAICSLLLFIVPSDSASFNLIWSLVIGYIFSIADTFYDMALNAIALRMTTNPGDRKNFFTLASYASTIGSMLPGWIIPIVLKNITAAQQQKWAYFFVALVFCVVGVSVMYAPYFTLKEKVAVRVNEEQDSKVRFDRQTLMSILTNRPLMIMLLAGLFDSIRQVTYKYLPYLYDNTFGDYGMKAIIDAVSGGLSYAGNLLVPLVGNKISSSTMLIAGYAYTGLFYVIIALFNFRFSVAGVRRYKWFIGILVGFAGMPNAALGTAKKILLADSTDYMEWNSFRKYGTAVRCDGMVCAAQKLSGNIYNFAKTNIFNISFALLGYKSSYKNSAGDMIKPEQADGTLRGIFKCVSLFGIVGNLLPCITYFFDNYKGKRKEMILTELSEIRSHRLVQDE